MRITPFGDAALLVQVEHTIDVIVNMQVLAAGESVRQAGVPGVRDVVPAYGSFAVHFDPVRTDVRLLRQVVERAARAASPHPEQVHTTPLEIPVCYGGRFGPDLAAVAAWARMDPHHVIAVHASPEYRVFMLGFLPGFPYMGSVDERIAMPRRDTPRARVAAGSVGIAGRQTGVYSFDSPGGWQIIGRTPLLLFDPRHEPPALLAPGQRVRFRSVSSPEFDAMRHAGGRR
ncbi:MAG: 5-oxoprolinase subunit PxpB [Aldersonia sp.]|nr:5-oxoprolinase subunit PxpB [Aldersonia sp.]